MKGISLHEPWATAIARDLKRIETRGFRLHYRGRLAICAARTTLFQHLIHSELLRHHFERVGVTELGHLSPGCIVATCRVRDVIPVEELTTISAQERLFGNYAPGRYGWILDDLARLKEPIPFRGNQGIFEIPDSTLRDAKYV